MALTNENINNAEERITWIQDDSTWTAERVAAVGSSLASDDNYQVFVKGTEIGLELNNKLNELQKLINSLNDTEIQNFIKLATQFVQLQRDLNGKGGN